MFVRLHLLHAHITPIHHHSASFHKVVNRQNAFSACLPSKKDNFWRSLGLPNPSGRETTESTITFSHQKLIIGIDREHPVLPMFPNKLIPLYNHIHLRKQVEKLSILGSLPVVEIPNHLNTPTPNSTSIFIRLLCRNTFLHRNCKNPQLC